MVNSVNMVANRYSAHSMLITCDMIIDSHLGRVQLAM